MAKSNTSPLGLELHSSFVNCTHQAHAPMPPGIDIQAYRFERWSWLLPKCSSVAFSAFLSVRV
jgi:hypothetical protein